MGKMLKSFLTDEAGATAIEYGLIAALIALLALVGMTTLGSNLSGLFNSVSNKATNVWNNAGP